MHDAIEEVSAGAIFGLMGAAVVELRARGLSVSESGIGALIVLNLIISFTFSGISIGAHIGGLIGGAVAALAIRAADDRRLPAVGMLACVLISAACVFGAISVAGTTGTGIA